MLTGAIIGLIVVALIYAYSAFRPVPPIETEFGGESETFSLPMPPDEVFKVAEGLTVSTTYKLGRADAQLRRIIFHDNVSLSSFGYFYLVAIAPAEGGSAITCRIKPRYPQWGPITRRQREKYLGTFVAALKAKLAGTI